MVPPGETLVVGVGVSVIARSAAMTVTELVPVAFEELVEETVAEPEITVLPAVTELTVTTSVKVAEPGLARADPSVQVTVPVAPTAGLVQVQPEATVSDEKVVLVGMDCVQEGAAAVAAALLDTTTA
jgi:hypothetical protein